MSVRTIGTRNLLAASWRPSTSNFLRGVAEKLGMDSEDVKVPADYGTWPTGLKARIRSARARAVLSVNEEMVWLYHRIGVDILARQQSQGWGAKVIDRLSADLREAFPDMKGLSVRNLKYMRDFARLCPDIRFGSSLLPNCRGSTS